MSLVSRPDSNDRKFVKQRRIAVMLAAMPASLNNCRVSVLPDGSPIIPVAPVMRMCMGCRGRGAGEIRQR